MVQANLCDLEQDIQNYFCNVATITLTEAKEKIVTIEVGL